MFFIVIDKNSIGICENISCKDKCVCSLKNKRGCISPAASLNFYPLHKCFLFLIIIVPPVGIAEFATHTVALFQRGTIFLLQGLVNLETI